MSALLTVFHHAALGAGAFTTVFGLASLAAAFALFRLRRPAEARELPPVTVLKPLKGLDRDLYACLESFCALDYPKLQLIFTLGAAEDAAMPVVARLREAHPELDIEIVVSKNRIGFNPKINNVSNAEPFIKHELLLISDSDIKVAPDFLKRMLAALTPEAGMVTAFYRSATPHGLWARLEALSVNAHFLPQAVVAAACGMRFAMGAAMLVRREAFERAGGFPLMASHIADDFILGKGILAAGYRLELADAAVVSHPDAGGGLDHLRHQVRWARTIRVCDPMGYAGLFLVHGFSLLTLKLLFSGADAATVGLLAGSLGSRALAAALIPPILGERRQSLRSLLLLPLSEWLAFGAWLAGFFSGRVVWRGERYRIERRDLAAAAPR